MFAVLLIFVVMGCYASLGAEDDVINGFLDSPGGPEYSTGLRSKRARGGRRNSYSPRRPRIFLGTSDDTAQNYQEPERRQQLILAREVKEAQVEQ